MKTYRILSFSFVFLIISLLVFPSFANSNDGMLVLNCATNQNEKQIVFYGDEYSLVKIADANIESVNGNDFIRYSTLPEYKKYDCDWNKLGASELQEKANKIEHIAKKNKKYAASTVVNKKGQAVFSNLEPALYLVMRTSLVSEHREYAVSPFFVSVPMKDEGRTCFTVTASPKYGLIPIDKKLPYTGQLNWPIPVLLVFGTILIVIGIKSKNHN